MAEQIFKSRNYELLAGSAPTWFQRNGKYLIGTLVVGLVGAAALAVHANKATSGGLHFRGRLRGFNIVDKMVGQISNFGSAVLPEDSMRAGCQAAGWYNKEKHGGPLQHKDTSAWTLTGDGLARFGTLVFSASSMEKGCINAGFYDPKLDTGRRGSSSHGFNVADEAVGQIANFGSAVLSEESMRSGCQSVGFYNKEKGGGGPLRRKDTSAWTLSGEGLARFGNLIFSRSSMEKGCINAGFYNPNLNG